MRQSVTWYSEKVGDSFFFWLCQGTDKYPSGEKQNESLRQISFRVHDHDLIVNHSPVEYNGLWFSVFECKNYYAATLMFSCMDPENCNWYGEWSKKSTWG